jgi:uncharacterized protein YdeI (BOF family)
MADHSKPVLTSLYANFLSELDARIDDLAVGLDPARTTATGQPTYSNRWSSVSSKWEQWNGTAWIDQAASYNINIGPSSTVNGSTIPSAVTLASTSNKLSDFSSTTSAELAGVVSDETGSGALVFNSSPTIVTPILTLKTGTTPVLEGEVQWDDINDKIVVGDGATTKYFIPTSSFSTDVTVSSTGVVSIQNNVITDTKLRQSGALTVIGRSSNSTGNVSDIQVAAGSGLVLRESGSGLGFGTIDTVGITDSAITYAKIQNVSATDKLLGRSTAGAGVIEEITCTPFARTLLDDTSAGAVISTLGLGTFSTLAGTVLGYVNGGTNGNSQAQARQNILPDATGVTGYVLKTSGPGTYFWAAEAGGTTNFGTTINSSQSTYTATAGQTVFNCGTYVLSKAQTRVYVNGLVLFPGDYTETSTTSITLAQACTAGDQVMVQVDGYVVYNPSATDISFSPTGLVSATTVQNAIAELDTEKQTKVTATGVLIGDGTGIVSAAIGTDITTLIGSNVVTNATNATNAITHTGTTTSSLPNSALASSGTADSTTYLRGDRTWAQIDLFTVPQSIKSANYTFVSTDAGSHVLHPSADTTARTFTIPANSSVPYPIGSTLTFVNQNGAGAVTIAITTDTMRWAGTTFTGSRTLQANGIATALKITSTEWIISGTGLL